jgi:hypothetical protein
VNNTAIYNIGPQDKGVIHSCDAQIYWTQDFRNQHLFIQQIRAVLEEEEK